ncbi:MAG: alanine--glyoxylate aminotransferase family protein [Candidatus Korarchaeota archaeon]
MDQNHKFVIYMNINRREVLFLPGPVEMHPDVYHALSLPPLGHRTKEFADTLKILYDLISEISGVNVENILVMFTSGTGVMEAAVRNLVPPKEKVLCLVNGAFGNRFWEIAKIHGCETIRLEKEWSRAFRKAEVEEALKKHGDVKAITVVHSETSSGVLNPVREITDVARKYGAITIVDAVSSFLVEEGVPNIGDIVVTASQKGIAGPPGIGIIFEQPEIREREREGSFYLSFAKYREYLAKGQTPCTPPINVIYGVIAALEIIKQVGVNRWISWHKKIWKAINVSLKKIGFVQFPEDGYTSHALNAFLHENSETLIDELSKYNIRIAGGISLLNKKIIRIGAMGWLRWEHIISLITTIELITGAQLGTALDVAMRELSPEDFPRTESGNTGKPRR